LVVNPSRDLPIAGASLFSRTGAVLMSASDGGSDHHVFVVVLANSVKTRSKTPLFAHRLNRWPIG
jgi:hypothetical protein